MFVCIKQNSIKFIKYKDNLYVCKYIHKLYSYVMYGTTTTTTHTYEQRQCLN